MNQRHYGAWLAPWPPARGFQLEAIGTSECLLLGNGHRQH
jgi:hypothetical protein